MPRNDKQIFDGDTSEKNFKKLFLTAIKATKDEDIKEHWDLKVPINNEYVKVDVKSIKRLNRYDILPNENIHWVELVNVRGDKGWLYGDSDIIAFETEDYFILVGTLKLRRFIEKKLGYNPQKNHNIQTSKNKIIYEPYQRSGRKDIVLMVKTIDLMHIRYISIKKQ